MKINNTWFAFGVMYIINKEGKTSYGSSPHFQLPDQITKQLLNGVELGNVMDKMLNGHNIKQKQGAIGVLTKGIMNRKELYTYGLITALVPFLNKDIYFNEEKKLKLV